jgi:nitrite reductase/ring-hydroxylating ferredoxin subunit
MRQYPHPISGAVYQDLGDGTVRVSDKAKGKTGVFRFDGTWIEGDMTYADPHMLLLVGEPGLPEGRDVLWAYLPPDESDAAITGPIDAPQFLGGDQPALVVGPYVGDMGMETAEGVRSAAYVAPEFLLANDRAPEKIPAVYHKMAPYPGGPRKVPVARYFERKYHDLEVEHLWKKTWQMVCREDDIPEVGDYHLHQIAELQYLVVRTAPGEFKAHVNACLHRGRQLRDCHGKRASEFRCPYHGWSWKLDGSLKELTSEWDFAGVREDVAQLPGARVATWGGFVFINPDPDAPSFEDYAGPEMLAHYAKFKLENRYKHADVVKVVRANWKLVQEAFLEGWHVLGTHPQLMLAGGEVGNCRFDAFGNWMRMGFLNVNANPHRGDVPTPAKALETYRAMADGNREYLRGLIGDEVEQFSDAELNEQSFNNLFPNFSPWGGWGRIVYRWRPNGDNPDECLMQVMLLGPWPEGKPKPAPRAQRFLGADEYWTAAPELGALARVFDQDCGNLPQTHQGLKTKQPPTIWLGGYQESAIRHFHDLYDERLGLTAPD